MAEPTPREISLRDPLSDVTRKERRLLLGMSVIGIALVKTGLLPEKISALGIDFSETNQKSLLTVFSFVTIYFLVAFMIYAAADFIAWRISLYMAIAEAGERREKQLDEERSKWDPNDDIIKRKEHRDKHLEEIINREKLVFFSTTPVSILRAIFEFLLPVIVGLYSTYLLLKASILH
jgi:hypothetical protein